ncbi:hypothetical protein ACJJI3_21470 [Microbulbifer sp. ZKSA004]|uniref:hypothetical protein n=1 Tax=Microbulbifer sp. ZKSA004 TaxID=3243389 RepID=UPI00403A08EF
MNKVFIASLFFILNCSAFAESEIQFQASEAEVVARSFDIVEGEVVSGTVEKPAGVGTCFSYVYDLKVENSFRGKYKAGEVIKIGLNLNSIVVAPNQQQLIVLMEPSKDFFRHCVIADFGASRVDKIVSEHLVGIFELFSVGGEVVKFRGVSCNRSKPILYEDFARERKWITGSCYEAIGRYQDLEKEIKKVVEEGDR